MNRFSIFGLVMTGVVSLALAMLAWPSSPAGATSEMRRVGPDSVFALDVMEEVSAGRLSASGVVRAAGRGAPWINLQDGRELSTEYVGAAGLVQVLRRGVVEPRALVAADFDEDGMPDLMSGYVGPAGGILTEHRGNVASIFPYALRTMGDGRPTAGGGRRARGDGPFLPEARVVEVPEVPDFVGAGDFDADGHQDVVVAARGGDRLIWLPGDGRGGFGEARSVELPGGVTALITGEINRRDGLTDVVVGVVGPHGPQVVVFEGPGGALNGASLVAGRAETHRETPVQPEILPLPDEATALALGQLDEHYCMDLAVAAGSELLIIHGRDRRLSTGGRNVAPAVIDQRSFPFQITSLVMGDFTPNRTKELALLSVEGGMYVLEVARGLRDEEQQQEIDLARRRERLYRRMYQEERRRHRALMAGDRIALREMEQIIHREARRLDLGQEAFGHLEEPRSIPLRQWTLREVAALGAATLVSPGSGRELIRVRISSRPTDDLVVIDPANRQLHILIAGDGRWMMDDGRWTLVSLDVLSAPVAVLPMRLNRDALSDLVMLREGEETPSVALTAAMATFVVDSTADDADFDTTDGVCDTNDSVGDGPCTLRAAIQQANASAGMDTIEFAIPGAGPHTIQPGSALPNITDPVVIDGYTQPGASANTNPVGMGLNTVLQIELDGSMAGTSNGLTIAAGSSVVRGLVINRFNPDPAFPGGIRLKTNGNIIEGNFVGTDVTGTVALENEPLDVATRNLTGSNTIGGTVEAARNLIIDLGLFGAGDIVQGNFIGTDVSGMVDLGGAVEGSFSTIGGTVVGARNVIADVALSSGAQNNLIQGNFIGTDVTGTAGLGSSGTGRGGITIQFGALDNTIGGTTPAARNVIRRGIHAGPTFFFGQGAINNLIQGNFIGMGVTDAPLDNDLGGITLTGDFHRDNTIGGTVAGAGNVIAFNGGVGVGSFFSIRTAVLSNSIFSNGGLGIDLGSIGVTPNDPGDADAGANNVQNFPVLTSVSTGSSTTIDGFLNSTPNTTFRLEFFANSECDSVGPGICDSLGFGEGETFLGSAEVITDDGGDVSFSVTFAETVPAGHFITATATDPDNNTSEFSQCLRVSGPVVCSLEPATASNPVGDSHTVTVTVTENGAPAVGISVSFDVLAGPNAGESGSDVTDASGQASFTYTSNGAAGVDEIEACGSVSGTTFRCRATKVWLAVALEPATAVNPVGSVHTVTAHIDPPTSGVVVNFEVTAGPNVGQSEMSITDASGRASFTYMSNGTLGTDTIEAGATISGFPFTLTAEKTWITPDVHCSQDIPKAFSGSFATSTLTIEDDLVIGDVNVKLFITHPFVFDVTVELISPNGTTVELFSNVDGSGDNFGSTCSPMPDCIIDDQAGTNIANGSAPFVGRFQSEMLTLGAFIGENAKGTWSLRVRSDFHPGTLECWCLEITPLLAACVLEPATATNQVGTSHTVTATVLDTGNPVGAGVTVNFEVTDGPNAGTMGTVITDANGQASFTYTSDGTPGVDTIEAGGAIDGEPFSCTTETLWMADICSTDAPQVLPSGETVTSTFTISEDLIINDLNVRLFLTHPFDFFLMVSLTSPGGTTVELFSGVGSTGDNFGSTCFPLADCVIDDQALTNIADGSAPFVGRFQSEGLVLGTFNGENARGTWTLTVTNDFLTGMLECWCLEITPLPEVACMLSPVVATNPVGGQHTVIATVTLDNEPVAGATVSFSITGGPNAGLTEMATTDLSGQASFTYTSNGTPGTDTIQASGSVSGVPFSCTAEKTWIDVSCTLAPATATNPAGTDHTVTATVTQNGAPASGVVVNFQVSGANTASGSATADASGQATFTYTGNNTGTDTIQASGSVSGVPFSCTAEKTWIDVSCTLAPATATNPAGTDHTVTATVTLNAAPASGAAVSFQVTAGPNAGAMGSGTTDAGGQASFTYTGSGGAGTDTITASGTISGVAFSCTAEKTWLPPECTLAPATATNPAGTDHTVTATVTADGTPLAGVAVNFEVVSGPNAGTMGSGTTDASGQASFTYTSSGTPGTDTIQAGGSVGGVAFSCTATKQWVTNRPPVAQCQDVTVSADGRCQGVVSAGDVDNGSFDPDGDPITLSLDPPGPYSLGATAVTLTVTDDQGATDSCTAVVTVVDTAPPQISCPADVTLVADAGCQAVFNTLATATDDCDPSPVISSDPPLPAVLAGPVGAGAVTHTITFTATDASGNSSSCTVTVTVVNNGPVADAGVDQEVDEGAMVTLDGSGSHDPDAGQPLTFQWVQVGGPAVTLSDPTSATPSFTAPEVGDGLCDVLVFELTVTDPCGATDTDTVNVSVNDVLVLGDDRTGQCLRLSPCSGRFQWRLSDGSVVEGQVMLSIDRGALNFQGRGSGGEVLQGGVSLVRRTGTARLTTAQGRGLGSIVDRNVDDNDPCP